jgi:hypothetical protein
MKRQESLKYFQEKKISGKVNSKQIKKKKRIDSLQTSGQKPLSLSLSLLPAKEKKKKKIPP